MYQAAIGDILGLRRHGATFSINPRFPRYGIVLAGMENRARALPNSVTSNPNHRSSGVVSAMLDGSSVDPNAISLAHDSLEHTIEIVLGREDRRHRPAIPRPISLR